MERVLAIILILAVVILTPAVMIYRCWCFIDRLVRPGEEERKDEEKPKKR